MPPIKRRNALQIGGVGLAATAIGRIGLTRQLPSRFDPVSAADLTERQAVTSTAGLLPIRLDAGDGLVPVAGREARTVS